MAFPRPQIRRPGPRRVRVGRETLERSGLAERPAGLDLAEAGGGFEVMADPKETAR